MGFSTNDRRIPDSFEIAKKKGLKFHFLVNEAETDIYPNTVDVDMVNTNDQKNVCSGVNPLVEERSHQQDQPGRS